MNRLCLISRRRFSKLEKRYICLPYKEAIVGARIMLWIHECTDKSIAGEWLVDKVEDHWDDTPTVKLTPQDLDAIATASQAQATSFYGKFSLIDWITKEQWTGRKR